MRQEKNPENLSLRRQQMLKYLNEKNEDTVRDNGLEEKEFDESGEVSNDVSDNGLSGDKQDSFAASEEEKGEE